MPVEISDWNDLDAVRNDLTGDYILVNGLDSETAGYAGIGDDFEKFSASGFTEDPFSGTFDGDGFAIKDFVLGDYGGERGNALFGGVGGGGLVENLTISGVVNVVGFSADGKYTGGLAGTVGASGTGTIQNCVAHVNVTSDDEEAGGLVGRNLGIVTDSYATGAVEGDEDVGGLVGRSFEDEIDSYWDTETTGQSTSDGDGIGLTTSEMQGSEAETNMSGFDFTNTWDVVLESDNDTTADGYPILISPGRESQLDAQGILSELDPPEMPTNLEANLL